MGICIVWEDLEDSATWVWPSTSSPTTTGIICTRLRESWELKSKAFHLRLTHSSTAHKHIKRKDKNPLFAPPQKEKSPHPCFIYKGMEEGQKERKNERKASL